MRELRWMIVVLSLLGGAIGALGLGGTANAAPLPVAAEQAGGHAPLLEQAHWRRHRHWHRRHWHHRPYWRRHHYRRHWHHRPYYRRHWHRRHWGYHRPYRVRHYGWRPYY